MITKGFDNSYLTSRGTDHSAENCWEPNMWPNIRLNIRSNIRPNLWLNIDLSNGLNRLQAARQNFLRYCVPNPYFDRRLVYYQRKNGREKRTSFDHG